MTFNKLIQLKFIKNIFYNSIKNLLNYYKSLLLEKLLENLIKS